MTALSETELEAALDAVRAACAATVAVACETDLGRLDKADRSPVTVADFAAQVCAAKVLFERCPDVPLVAEEGSEQLREADNAHILARVARVSTESEAGVLDCLDLGAAAARSERYWTLDPIDGTKGYLRGKQYAVALGLIENGSPRLGVLGCPNLDGRVGRGVVLYARRNEGCWETGLEPGSPPRRVAVGRCDEAANLVVCESVESGHSRHDVAASVAERLGVQAAPRRADSQVKYALVARGDAHVYWRLPTRVGYEEKIWDHAAGALIVTEAGGRVTDIDGRSLDFSCGKTLSANRGVLATNGPVHEEILRAIDATLGTQAAALSRPLR